MNTLPWDDLYFASEGEVTCNTIRCANRLTASIQQISAASYILKEEVIGASLAGYPIMELLGLLYADNSGIKSIRVWKIIYLLEIPCQGYLIFQVLDTVARGHCQ